MSFRPFKVKEEKKVKVPDETLEVPLMGRSTYNRHYPSWGRIAQNDAKIPDMEEIKVPLRGVPNYTESYPRYDAKYYTDDGPLNFTRPTLRFTGELDPRTTYNEAYKPNDLTNRIYFPDDDLINGAKGESTVLKSAPNAPGNMGTTYRRDYIKYDDFMCRLRKWLNARGMRYLVI